MPTLNRLQPSPEHSISRLLGPRPAAGVIEFFVFGVKQAAACVFAGSFLFLLAISSHVHIHGLARYDFLFLSAIAIQILLVAVRLENWREVAVLSLFHLIGIGLELFKTAPSVRSWSYPEPAFFHLKTVPLYSGFMYASVASYIMQAWRLMKVKLTEFPPFPLAVGLCAAIYANFFTNHYMADLRWPLAAAVLLLFRRTQVYFTVDQDPAKNASGTLFSADRVFHLGGGKYRHLFWRLAISASETAMGDRRADQDQLVDASGDHQFHYRGSIERAFPQAANCLDGKRRDCAGFISRFIAARSGRKMTSENMDGLKSITADPRVNVRRDGVPDRKGRCVVYWMQRSQRSVDNPALEVAVKAANLLGKPCVVFFAPVPFYPHANLRHYRFLQQGIVRIAGGLKKRGIGFVLRRFPDHSLLRFCEEVRASLVVADENPMREPESWRQTVAKKLRVPFWTVDSDVIVPAKLLMKEQYGAYTARPVIRRLLPDFLKPVGNTKASKTWAMPQGLKSLPVDFDVMDGWPLDRSVAPVPNIVGGSDQALKRLKRFIKNDLACYPLERNKPELDSTSHLSAYLHFGHIGPHTVALAVQKSSAPRAAKEAFLEQLIVRRELAVNFVRFNPDYDNFESGTAWAHKSLADHAGDPRKIYSERQLENAQTHDPLWNAAQLQMTLTGFMHNYLRMYWAKKILEWSKTPARAFQMAVYLNDKYELDGRDPNGYAGIAWAIVGKHDRPWFDRPIFGQIRYMSFNSTSKKFDSKRYIAQIEAAVRDVPAK